MDKAELYVVGVAVKEEVAKESGVGRGRGAQMEVEEGKLLCNGAGEDVGDRICV